MTTTMSPLPVQSTAPAMVSPEATGLRKATDLKCPSVLLIGTPGSGKTHSIITLLKAGLEVFVIITDPAGVDALLDAVIKENVPVDNLHYKYVAKATPKWAALKDMSMKINTMGYEDLTKLKSGISKTEYQQFIQLIGTLDNFVCDRTGKAFGDVTTWGDTRALVIDGLSGVSTMAMDMTIGAKPAAHQGEWGVAMNVVEKFVLKCCADIYCFFVCIGHLEREVDEVEGGVKNMVSTLGKKLAPKLPKDFSDVVLAERSGDKFSWSTNKPGFDLKAATLPLKSGLDPDFGQVVNKFKARKALAQKQP